MYWGLAGTVHTQAQKGYRGIRGYGASRGVGDVGGC